MSLRVEARGLGRRLARPANLTQTIWHLSFQVIALLKRRLGRTTPSTWRDAAHLPYASGRSAQRKGSGSRLPPAGYVPADQMTGTPREIRLATRSIQAPVLAWDREFEDHEDTAALHRWRWLLEGLSPQAGPDVRDWGISIALDWCQRAPRDLNHCAWEPYTVAERICNFLIFAAATGTQSAPSEALAEVVEEVRSMAFTLSRRLEFFGTRSNNHLLNNARALYLAGQFLNESDLSDIARAIFRNETNDMITAEGFLREGSSHYHLLLTRTFLEVVWAAESTNDLDFAAELRPNVTRMVERARFFVVRGESGLAIPFFGDISPDCTPGWLATLPWSRLAAAVALPTQSLPVGVEMGWAALWGTSPNAAVAVASPSGPYSFEAWPASGWFRFDAQDLTVFWRVEPSGTLPLFASHGHNDTGSFVAFVKGDPVFVDSGRSDYNVTPQGRTALSANAHNSVTVDALEPFVLAQRRWFPAFYRRAKVTATWRCETRALCFTIVHDGYARFGDGISVRRNFTCREDSMEIIDEVTGSGTHSVERSFYCAANASVTVDSHSFRVVTSSMAAHCSLSTPAEPRPTLVADGYGRTRSTVCVRETTTAALPVTLRAEIGWMPNVRN